MRCCVVCSVVVGSEGIVGVRVAREGARGGFLVEAEADGDEVFDGEALADDRVGVGLRVEVEEVEEGF